MELNNAGLVSRVFMAENTVTTVSKVFPKLLYNLGNATSKFSSNTFNFLFLENCREIYNQQHKMKDSHWILEEISFILHVWLLISECREKLNDSEFVSILNQAKFG